MSEELEYRCFIGGLSWSTSDKGLKDAFDKFGKLVEAKVIHYFCCIFAFSLSCTCMNPIDHMVFLLVSIFGIEMRLYLQKY